MSQDGVDIGRRRRHWEMLIACVLIVILSFALIVRDDGRVAPRWLEGYPVPETCLSHSLFGLDCPACGLTRSFIELARGSWSGALGYHRVGWLMALAVLLQIPYRAFCLRTNRPLPRRVASLFGYTLITALLVNWLVLLAR